MIADGAPGYLALLLHAHLPFINNRAEHPTLEEKWLFEALTESYLPFLISWERLAAEGTDFQLTLSVSPTLISMLTDPAVLDRYGRYLDKLNALAELETERTKGDPYFHQIAEFYRERLLTVDQAFKSVYQTNLIRPLQRLCQQGHVELITTCATHGFLPLMATDEARYAQVRLALDLFGDVFGRPPAEIWLPECGYIPGVEKILESLGIRYFTVAAHGMLNANPRPEAGVYAPVRVAGGKGIAAFGRDWETSHQVWSRTEGYPGDPAYREFYRDIGYDLDFAYVEPYLIGNIRGDTGFKYYRITGRTDAKEVYDRRAALARVREHALDFLANRDRQISRLAEAVKDKPIVVAPYDAELFGHWWFEGPEWLEEVFRRANDPGRKIRLTTLSGYLEKYPPRQEVSLGPSSWGDGGYNRVWLNPGNDWIYPLLHRAEKALISLADRYVRPGPLERRALNQAVRELMLAQSSDWPFIITNQTVVDYARRRLNEHLEGLRQLVEELEAGAIDEDHLKLLEARDNIFPKADYRLYRSRSLPFAGFIPAENRREPIVLMLSWEYPPRHVGGLGVHVRDLAEALARRGVNVHVLTPGDEDWTHSSERNGVLVHTLAVPQQPEKKSDFLSWTLQYNLAMADFGQEFIRRAPRNRIVIHAHDWMVGYAGRELQRAYGLPLLVTIHATEYGRNKGLHDETQRRIHRLEADLTNAADQIICCSRYMEHEIQRLFQIDPAKIRVIPNAVGPIPYREVDHDKRNVLFVGRLVVEKGVQVLLDAFAMLLDDYPEAKLTIAGTGPYAWELKKKAESLGLMEQVRFAGFVSESVRNELLAQSQVAVFPSLYEPFGIVALEAMAAGVPVVVARTGGLAETVDDGLTGLVCEPGDPEDLRRCLSILFDDPGLAGALCRNARAKVEKEYTWEAVADQTYDLYQLALQKKMMKAG